MCFFFLVQGEGRKKEDFNKDNTNSVRDGNKNNVHKQEDLKNGKEQNNRKGNI